MRPLERQVYKRFDKIICISSATRTELLKWIGEGRSSDADVIYNGARLFSINESRKRDKRGLRLVSVASLDHQKGIDVALEAIARVRSPVVQYVIIGQGPDRDRLEKQARVLGLHDIVQFAGWQNDVEPWLHDADLMLIPSRWEGFGLMAVEALSTGLPVVATNVPGLREVLTGTPSARLVDREDPAGLAAAIDSFSEKDPDTAQLARMARERAEEYRLDTMVKKYASAYREVRETCE